VSNSNPATAAQLRYITRLAIRTRTRSLPVETSAEASAEIERLQALRKPAKPIAHYPQRGTVRHVTGRQP
jgi:hypothetical protein